MASSLLIPETPHQVIPSLAAKIGLNETLFLQQLHWLLQNNECCAYEGHIWWKHTTEQWLGRMPYFSEKTVKRTIAALKKQRLVITDSLSWKIEKIRGDRTSWYRINYNEVDRISAEIQADKSKAIMQISEENTVRAPEKARSVLRNQNTHAAPVNTGKGQNDPMSSGQSGPMLYKTYKKDLSSSSKPEPAQVSVNPFDFDLVMTWLLTQFSDEYDLTNMDKAFIEASLEEYEESAQRPSKARALSWVETALKNRISTGRRSLKISHARDQRNDAATGVRLENGKYPTLRLFFNQHALDMQSLF